MTFTDKGREQILQHLAGTLSHFALGTDGSSEDLNAQTLGDEQFRKSVTDTTIDSNLNLLDVECFVGAPEANGHDFQEIGLLDAGTGGNLFFLKNFPAQTKTNQLEWLIDVFIEVR